MNVMRSLFGITVVVALVLFLFVAVEGSMSQSCQCYFVGSCEYDEHHIGFRYRQCTGSCYAYSDWMREPKCQYPNEKPRDVWRELGY